MKDGQQWEGYYGTGRRPESEKTPFWLILALLALVILANALTLMIHRASGGPGSEPPRESEGDRLLLLASETADTLTESGNPCLGLRVCDIGETQRRYWKLPPEGVLVHELAEGGCAEAAGLQRGDVIVTVQEKTVTDTESFRAAVADCAPGDVLTVSVYRAGTYYEIEIVIAE